MTPHVTLFECKYDVNEQDGAAPRPLGKSVARQVTDFLENKDAWPVASSLTVTPLGEHQILHSYTLAWVPREAWERVQAEITANAMTIYKQRQDAIDA